MASTLRERMRDDWDRRAKEDAQFYVAFGRRKQSPEEFFASATEVVDLLRAQYARIQTGIPLRRACAVEIGCGPGRLMVPLSEDFGRIVGFDVSPQMVQLARTNLTGRVGAEARQCAGSDLPGVPDASADFVYSYAVFQHIPEEEPVWSYLRDAVRVLKPGGALACQVHGLEVGIGAQSPARAGWSRRACVDSAFAGEPPPVERDTWSGVRLTPEQLAAFCSSAGLELLEFRGIGTQYLWMVARKPSAEARVDRSVTRIARITNAYTSDTVIPRAGVFASATVWVRGLPRGLGLTRLAVRIGETEAAPCYVGETSPGQPTQVNVFLPPGLRTGVHSVSLLVDGEPLTKPASLRVGPEPPLIPRLVRLSDGVNLLDHGRVVGNTLKLQIEELQARSVGDARERTRITLNRVPLAIEDVLCIDPRLRLFEYNVRLPADQVAGQGALEFRLGPQKLASVGLHVVR